MSHPRMRLRLISSLAAAAALVTGSAAAASIELQLAAGDHDREQTPVQFALPASLAKFEDFKLTRVSDGASIPVQRYRTGKKPKVGWILQEALKAGETRRYRLEGLTQPPFPAPRDQVTVEDDGKALQVEVGGRPALRYNYEVVESPEGIDPIYRRSGHIHPLFTPSGREVTGDFPVDHPHQHAIFFAWVNSTLDGKRLDFWNQAAKNARIEHARFHGKPEWGPVFAKFSALLRHQDVTSPESPQPVLNENWIVRVYNTKGHFIVDLYSRQRNVSVWPLVIKEYHYGAMAIRGTDQWFDAKIAEEIKAKTRKKSKTPPEELAKIPVKRDFLTSEGKTWMDGNATEARWVEMHGKIDGAPAGITAMGHPDNFRAPQTVRLHPSKPYFCFAPMAKGQFEIKPDEEYVSRFRFYLHDGPVDAKESERHWNDYANPPKVSVVKK